MNDKKKGSPICHYEDTCKNAGTLECDNCSRNFDVEDPEDNYEDKDEEWE